MAVQLPKRFTQAWIEDTVPKLSQLDAEVVLAAMRAKGWTDAELEARVYPHLRGRAAKSVRDTREEEVTSPQPRERSRRSRLRRRPSLAEASALAGIIGAVAAVVGLIPVLTDSGKSATPPPPKRAGPAPRSSLAAADALRKRIPAAIRASCAPDDAVRKKFKAVADFRCDLRGADQVVYLSYPSVVAMTRIYRPTAVHLSAGNCGKQWGVESTFSAGSAYPDIGLLRCYTSKGVAWIEWTRADLFIYAYMSRADGNRVQLFNAWLSAGPVP
jgi:hypothetical protein